MISAIKNAGSLFIRELKGEEELATVEKVASAWSHFAGSMISRCDRNTKEYERLSDCESICHHMNTLIALDDSAEFYICEDAYKKIQGIMCLWVSSLDISVMGLVTNPANLMPEQARNQSDPMPVRGVGTSLIETSVKRAIELKKCSVHLDSFPLAVGFYQRMGFSLVLEKESEIISPMALSIEKIHHLYAHLMPVQAA
jgi:hypothetical protein